MADNSTNANQKSSLSRIIPVLQYIRNDSDGNIIKIVRESKRLRDIVLGEEEMNKRQNPTRLNAKDRARNPGYALEQMSILERFCPKEFTRMFRLNPASFSTLLNKVSNIIDKPGKKDVKNFQNQDYVQPKTRLAVSLRWLAGGSVHDICFAFGVAIGTFYQEGGVLWGTLEAIDQVEEIKFPTNIAVLEGISEGFSKYSKKRLRGCVMAMDGWVCKTRKPYAYEVRNVIAYRNRKNCWGIVVFAGCDHRGKFIMFSPRNSGATNDSLAWDCTLLKIHMESSANFIPAHYYFVCDEAVQCCERVLTPYGGRGIGRWKDSFNFHLSAMRQTIERAFGMLTRRWGIFWRPLQCAQDRWALVCNVAAKLHNICIDQNIPFDHGVYEDYEQGDMPSATFLNEWNPENLGHRPINAHNSSTKRSFLTYMLQQKGITRPQRSTNSRA